MTALTATPSQSTPPRTASAGLKRFATIAGLVGFVLFVLTPLLPVQQTQSSFDWPTGEVSSVTAPLISYTPESLALTVPLSAVSDLPPGVTTVVSTLPGDAKEATTRGMFIRSTDGDLDVVIRDKVPLELTAETLESLPAEAMLSISSTSKATTLRLTGVSAAVAAQYDTTVDEDVRPQLTGIYTDLPSDDSESLIAAGLAAHVEINSRFTSSPSLVKYVAMIAGLLSLLASLFALAKIDALDGRGHRRFFPANWFRPTVLDGLVVAGLSYWYVFGANTSDDGYLLTMARESQPATYMANYYRWYGVPESPFGAPYYDLLGLMTQVSTTSMWMRLPGFFAGVLTWWLITKEVLPRLGAGIAGRKVAHWTAASAFLAFWMIYNNGLRPEPVIALGALLTWLSIERAIATSRLLPFAVGVIVATLSLGAGPTGLMAVAALLAGLSSLIRIVYRKLPQVGCQPGATRRQVFAGAAPLLAPILASGTAILVAVFGDQTLATVLESIRVRGWIGPSLKWYEEWVRYYTLMLQNPDGSFTRRFPVLMLFFYLAVVLASVLKNGRVPGSAPGPANRLLLVFFGTLFFMMFTPTKWTHHFGVYAGIGAALAGLAAVAVSQFVLARPRNKTLFIAAILFVLAFSLSGTNGWWYVSAFGIPWYDKTVQYHHVQATDIMLVIALIVLLVAAVQSFRSDVAQAKYAATHQGQALPAPRRRARSRRFDGLVAAPLAVATTLVVLFSMASLAKGFVAQYPAYSVALGNLRSLTGNTCQLASDVMVETNTNDSFLTPVGGVPLGDSLNAGDLRGFEANKLPPSITDELSQEPIPTNTAGAQTGVTDGSNDPELAGQASGKEGGIRGEVGINGSVAQLPFGIDYRQVPVVGSWTDGPQFPAEDTTVWFTLPARSETTPLLVVSAAGRIAHHDYNGVEQDGQKLVIEYGTMDDRGNVTDIDEIEPFDVGKSPQWRNLRIPLDAIPESANVVRIVASDLSLDKDQWLAFTPPRVPELQSLNGYIPANSPGLIDWTTALQFPCQRPFFHYAGVTEIPQWRISPDHEAKETHSQWQGYDGGGIMGVAQAVASSIEIPTYLNEDWHRDWGSLERYVTRGNNPQPADIKENTVTRTGWWSPGHMWLPEERG
ncbi:arabinosyltransferase domain-containing protein [Corynebacterium choanae]|uniref:Putative arabinosyltransferase C n=1 Tax=Corynebacterium choanae TaxID=1862358 RepID=A0A3G6JDB1_9CORY|nr:arabinosyltransferase domain-containing protein [Corynebacterium choanae]AZA14650.1 putative arabinosyltransferase C [Corynebacterium choanae]